MGDRQIPWWGRIKLRVLVFGVLMSIIPVMLVSLYYIYYAKRDLQQSVQVQNKLLVEEIAQQVDTLLQQTEGTLKETEFALAAGGTGSTPLQLYHLLKEIPMADEAVVMDSQGVVRQAVDRFKIVSNPVSLAWHEQGLLSTLRQNRVYYSQVTFLQTGIPLVRLVVPYFSSDGRTFLGGVGVQVRLRSLFALVSSNLLSRKQDVFLVDSGGRLIADNDFTRVLRKADVGRSFSVQHFLQEGDPDKLPIPNKYVTYTGQEVLGVYSQVLRTGWGVVAEQPTSVAFASINSLLVRLSLFLLAIILAAVGLSIVFGLYFTRPIEYLEGAVHQVGEGVLNTTINLRRSDELGHLAHAFNEMTSELRSKSENLLLEKERLDAIVNGIGVGLALIYPNHVIAWMNPVLAGWLGARTEKETCFRSLAGLEGPCAECPLSLGEDKPDREDVTTTLAREGEHKLFRHRIYNLAYSHQGDPDHLLVVEDITEQRRMEEMVMQADKLSALGLMASGFAHEINNPLATIQAYAEDLGDRLNLDRAELVASGDMERYLGIIQDNIARSKRITHGLLNFSRKSEWKLEWIDVSAVLTESMALLNHALVKKQVQLVKRWESDLPMVKGDPLQLMQVVVNLLNNALDAVALGGIIGIEARVEEQVLLVRIFDNGAGIKPQHLPKVFDPFFTTKEAGRGTGLGLSVSYGIISRMGGTISIGCLPEQGTEVCVSLPL